MLEKLKSRKLIVAAVCLAAGVALEAYTGQGISDNLLTLMLGILGAYTTGNVVTKFAPHKTSTKAAPKKQPQAAPQAQATASAPAQKTSPEQRVDALEKARAQHEEYLQGLMSMLESAQSQIQELSNRISHKE